MEGVIDPLMREHLSGIGGFDQMVTEFVRITQQLLPDKIFYKYSPELHHGGKTLHGTPVFIQLLGSDSQLMGENAHKACELGAPGIDLNFGCPAKTVNRHDGGATLLKNPERVFKVIEAVRRHTPAHLPVTAKVRLGFSHKDFCQDIARAVEDGGAQKITIHARTRDEAYRPPAHWEYIALMKDVIQKIEVVANGDLWSAKDIHRCLEVTGCQAIALGRAAMASPFLAKQLQASAEEGFCTHQQTLQSLYDFAHKSQQQYGEAYTLRRLKQWLRFIQDVHPWAKPYFAKIKVANTIERCQVLFLG